VTQQHDGGGVHRLGPGAGLLQVGEGLLVRVSTRVADEGSVAQLIIPAADEGQGGEREGGVNQKKSEAGGMFVASAGESGLREKS
jgi:hypothetical protein